MVLIQGSSKLLINWSLLSPPLLLWMEDPLNSSNLLGVLGRGFLFPLSYFPFWLRGWEDISLNLLMKEEFLASNLPQLGLPAPMRNLLMILFSWEKLPSKKPRISKKPYVSTPWLWVNLSIGIRASYFSSIPPLRDRLRSPKFLVVALFLSPLPI